MTVILFKPTLHIRTIYIYIYICVCVCLSVRACVCVCVWLSVCARVRACVYVHIYIYIYIYAYKQAPTLTRADTHTHTHSRIYIYIYIRGWLNKFPGFFVQASKIVVECSMLLLCILWDDWPIFKISGSNEQLQQELEYTLLKPDCQNWWILKMLSVPEDTLWERYAIKFCFKLGKKCHRNVWNT